MASSLSCSTHTHSSWGQSRWYHLTSVSLKSTLHSELLSGSFIRGNTEVLRRICPWGQHGAHQPLCSLPSQWPSLVQSKEAGAVLGSALRKTHGLRGRGAELRWGRGRGLSGQRLWVQKGGPALGSGSKPSGRPSAFPPLLSNHVNSEGAHADPGMTRVSVTTASLDSQG